MDARKIVDALARNAHCTFLFDVTTGVVEREIIGADGTSFTRMAGLTAPHSFDDIADAFLHREERCGAAPGEGRRMSRALLLDSYASGNVRPECDVHCRATDSRHMVQFFLYGDDASGHILAYVVCRQIAGAGAECVRPSRMPERGECFHKKLFDDQSCGVLAYTCPGDRIVDANAEALRMFGVRSVGDLQRRLPEIAAAVYDPSPETRDALERLREEDGAVDYAYVRNRGRADECRGIARAKVVYSPEGQRMVCTTYADASEMRVLDDALARAEAGDRAQSAFLFHMSHDLLTPLNAILGCGELIRSHWDDRAAAEGYLRQLMRSGRLLSLVLNNAIEAAGLERDSEPLQEDVWDAERFNDALDAIIAGALQEKDLRFTRRLNVSNGRVRCDAAKIRIILLNLLSNAIKYTPAGGKIDVRLEELPSDRAGYARFQTVIADSGIGIDPDFLPRIFERFSRERNTSLSGIHGAGLGMAVVKQLVDRMGGSIRVDSRPGEGTTVTVILEHRVAEGEERSGAGRESGGGQLRGKRILLVEDNGLNAEIAMAILSDAGLACEHVADGAQAVAAVEAHPAGYYDLALMDIQMPVMDGYRATREIRGLAGGRSAIPIVAMTANALPEDRRAAMDAGMNGHIAKPIEIPKLMDALYRLLAEPKTAHATDRRREPR